MSNDCRGRFTNPQRQSKRLSVRRPFGLVAIRRDNRRILRKLRQVGYKMIYTSDAGFTLTDASIKKRWTARVDRLPTDPHAIMALYYSSRFRVITVSRALLSLTFDRRLRTRNVFTSFWSSISTDADRRHCVLLLLWHAKPRASDRD